MTRFIRISDYKEMLRPTGPMFAFLVPWSLVLIGQLMQLCHIIVPVYSAFYLIVLGNMVTICALAFALQTAFPQQLRFRRKLLEEIHISKRFKQYVALVLTGYLLIQGFQVFYFKGFPLLWILSGSSKVYVDYGIHSLNGLLNAIYLLGVTGFFLIYVKERKRWHFFFLLFLMTLPILLVTRQLFMSLFLQMLCCALLYKPRLAGTFFKLGCVILAVFIFVGNIRTGLSSLISILQPKDFVPQFLYPLLWIYAYIVTPFNNINASFDAIAPLGSPFHELQHLIPSIFRDSLMFEGGNTGFSLVHKNMTVSSFYLEPLLDFGPVWAFVFMALFQLQLIRAYRRAVRSCLPIHTIEYAVYYMIAILSIFSNLLLFLPVVAQLILIQLAKLKLKSRQGRLLVAIGPEV